MQHIHTGEGRIAVITGGAMGIGGDVSARLAAAGFAVVIADLDKCAADKAVASLTANGSRAEALLMDVGAPESVAAGFAEIERQFGRCDVLVNCAAIAKVMPFLEFSLDVFQATLAVNVTGTFLCAQAAAQLMVRNRWGRIVNFASVAGLRAVGTGRTAYGTLKGAVIALTRQMAVELAEYGVTANAVCPGPVDTPMTRAMHTDRFREQYSNAIPMARYGSTAEISSAVLYLVSETAAYVTGIALPVDGGFLASGARGL